MVIEGETDRGAVNSEGTFCRVSVDAGAPFGVLEGLTEATITTPTEERLDRAG